MDWASVFLPTTPILEVVVRGSIAYLTLFTLVRLTLKRVSGTINIGNLLMIVLLADAIQNGMAGGYESLTDGILLVGVIIFWTYALDWLGYRSDLIGRFVHPPALPLVEDGRVLRRNLRQELITMDELLSVLREHGIDNVSDVASARMEGDGRISVISRDHKPNDGGGESFVG